MTETIILGLISTYFAYLSRYKKYNWGLKLSFVLIFLFLALRFNFGNDYQAYLMRFDLYKSEKISYDLFSYDFFEPGWILLNWLFKKLGFFSMNFFLAFLSSIIYYRFIVKYVLPKYYWLAVFFYVFNINLLLIQLSAMRQTIAIILFVFSIDFLNENKMLKYILCIVLASFFHYSSILLLALFFLILYKKKIGTYGTFVIFLFYLFIIFGSNIFAPYINNFVRLFYTKYEFYQEKGTINSGLGYVYYSIILILILYLEKRQNKEVRLVSKIAILSILLIPLSQVLDIMGRFYIYLAPASIVAYPNLISEIQKPLNKIIICTIMCAFTLFQFFQFFYSDVYNEYYMNYNTIFLSPKWY